MSYYNYLSEKAILPLSDLVLGMKISSSLAFLQESQYWSRNELSAHQFIRLKELINHAHSFVPYYKNLFLKLNIRPEDFRSLSDLQKLPILTKATIKQEGIEKFASTVIKNNKRILNSSSGSTGEPLFYYNTREAYSMNLASSIRGWYWMGYRFGDRFIKLSQNIRETTVKKIQDKITRNLYLAVNPLTNSNFDHILNEIDHYKPGFIRCYPDPLLFLARYKKNHPEFTHTPISIATTGNTLYPETRREIEDAFGCKVFDAYNCEGNSTVFECPNHTCYHSSEEYGISEILDEENNPVSSGTGRLITTDLWNLAHPFIRYDTQDLVETDDIPCKCGRSLLKINKILGRDNEILIMENGRKFIVHNFTGFFQSDSPNINRSVDQFQVVKRRDDTVLIRIIVNARYNNQVKDYILKYWEAEFKTKVIVEKVEQIPLTVVGKRKFILNEEQL